MLPQSNRVLAITSSSGFSFNLKPEVRILSCNFDVEHYHDDLFEHYGIALPLDLSSAVAKRRCEYLAGRVLYKQLLQQIGHPYSPLLRSAAGAPLWPADLTGSISHADGIAICCLCPRTNYKSVGIDIESHLSAQTCTDIQQMIMQPDELRYLQQFADIDYTRLVSLVFSAKESLYKALFPDVGRFFGFEDAAILSIEPDSRQFTLRLTTRLNQQHDAGQVYHGHYRWQGEQVVSLITLAPQPL